MSDQILSQEEIDALLTSVDKGEVDLEVDKKVKAKAESYDLTSRSMLLRYQFYALEEVYDKFSDLLRNSLSSSILKSLEIKFISMEMVKFGQFLGDFSSPTSFNIFNMEPLIGSSLLVIEPGLVFSLIDCMFGGNGKPVAKVREFTLIELRMMRKFAVEVLRSLEKAMDIVHPVKILLEKVETKPEFAYMIGPNDLVISVVFSVKGDEFSGELHLCIPYLVLEPIREKLSSRYIMEKSIVHTFADKIRNSLNDTNITLIAELGRTSYTIRDILNLRAGDILKVNTGPQDPITINVEDVPKYQGVPGVVRGNRAVQVTRLFR